MGGVRSEEGKEEGKFQEPFQTPGLLPGASSEPIRKRDWTLESRSALTVAVKGCVSLLERLGPTSAHFTARTRGCAPDGVGEKGAICK